MTSATGVLVLTGIMAAGKSTVAQLVAQRLPRSVHVRGDVFRRMVVSGRDEPRPGFPDDARAQLELRYRLSAQTADGYAAAGFTVLVQDIILGADLPWYLSLISTRPRHLVVLAPDPESVAEREKHRAKTGYVDGWTPQQLDRELRAAPPLGCWLDTSAQTPEQTAEAVLANWDRARIDPPI